MMHTGAQGFYILSNTNQGYALSISKPTRSPLCPFQNQFKTRLNWCLRLSKTQGSSSPWKHTLGFVFPFPNNLKFLFTFRRLQIRLNFCLRLSKTQGSSSPWNHKGTVFAFSRLAVPLHHGNIHRSSLSLFQTTSSSSSPSEDSRLILASVFVFPRLRVPLHHGKIRVPLRRSKTSRTTLYRFQTTNVVTLQDVCTVSPDDSVLPLRFAQVCLSISYVTWITKVTLRRS